MIENNVNDVGNLTITNSELKQVTISNTVKLNDKISI